jgi:hypothetical protein
MRCTKTLVMIFGMLVLFSATMSVSDNRGMAKADQLSDISDMLNATMVKLNNIEMNLSILKDITIDLANGNTTSIRMILQNLTSIQSNMTILNITTLTTRLDIIDDMVTDLNSRLGYNISNPDATVYKDLSLILDGLSYTNNGIRYWLLKNVSGVPHLQILGENQQLMADYQLSMNQTFLNNLEQATTDINLYSEQKSKDVQGSNGFLADIIIVLIIILIAIIIWKFFLKEKKDKEHEFRERMEMSKGHTGRPKCFGDSNQFDPETNQNCNQCNWIAKCQSAVVRNTKTKEIEKPGDGIETIYDDDGNITEITDEGETIEIPECFGVEFNPRKNRDCRDCAINEFCGEQTQKNIGGKIKIPQQPKKLTSSTRKASGLVMASQATGPEDVLADF